MLFDATNNQEVNLNNMIDNMFREAYKTEMQKWIAKALETWCPKDHPLHLDPLHPAMGLAGEAGKLIDLYKKELYKKGYSWWDCKNCGKGQSEHYPSGRCKTFFECNRLYTPLVLDELGDLTYYLRILMYQSQSIFLHRVDNNTPLIDTLAFLGHYSNNLLIDVIRTKQVSRNELEAVWFNVLRLCNHLETDLKTVLELNYAKLSAPGGNGWQKTLDEARK